VRRDSSASLPDVEARLDQLAALAGLPRQVEPLAGGLTNLNYTVSTPTGRYVARLAGRTGSLLAIDRDAEYRNALAAATTGVAPAVVEYSPQAQLLLIAWVPGRTLTDADLRDEAVLARVARACKTLHGGPRFVGDFDMFAVQQRYLRIVQENGFRLPQRYLDFAPAVQRIAAALARRAEPTVPCHNDLLAANILDTGERIWLIDYEYAGNNEPCFELGNIWSEAGLPLEHLEALVAAYYGRPLRHKVARARLLGLMSKYGWTLWASIQDGASPLDFDFWTWGMQKYDRAVAEFDGPDLPVLLDDVAQRTD
jgi:thiamine kinase-like enzyme